MYCCPQHRPTEAADLQTDGGICICAGRNFRFQAAYVLVRIVCILGMCCTAILPDANRTASETIRTRVYVWAENQLADTSWKLLKIITRIALWADLRP